MMICLVVVDVVVVMTMTTMMTMTSVTTVAQGLQLWQVFASSLASCQLLLPHFQVAPSASCRCQRRSQMMPTFLLLCDVRRSTELPFGLAHTQDTLDPHTWYNVITNI
jgi:hypothetical protein